MIKDFKIEGFAGNSSGTISLEYGLPLYIKVRSNVTTAPQKHIDVKQIPELINWLIKVQMHLESKIHG